VEILEHFLFELVNFVIRVYFDASYDDAHLLF
jgi:hypothetical protein